MQPVYNHREIETKWQAKWAEGGFAAFRAVEGDAQREKKYILDMFPYPSAAGLHVGHPEGYTATDIYSRYLRARGFNVLHPMGWDAFGLPAENYAIKVNKHPRQVTEESIVTFRRQIQALGFSYDWSREFSTTDPAYIKWSQWFFLLLYKNGLAYRKKAPVNWCEHDKTVLANEQVVDGKCERCKNPVVQKDLEQWFFKVTAFADRLLDGLDQLEWSDALKTMQRNWIGKSEGAEIRFNVIASTFAPLSVNSVKQSRESGLLREYPRNDVLDVIKVFTTRQDTLWGAAFVALAPEHPMVANYELRITNYDEVRAYVEQARKKSDLQRTDLAKEKTGVELKGVKAINPANGEEIPIWVADFVLGHFGTGALFGDAHDERDVVFARKYRIPLRATVKPTDGTDAKAVKNFEVCYTGEGELCDSAEFSGMTTQEARPKIAAWLEAQGKGKATVTYKMRDWLVSRQRYWGAPIPIIYCDACGEVPAADIDDPASIAKNLPINLPEDVDWRPTGVSPLAASKTFQQVSCPKCGSTEGVRRETDTMDGFVDNSWYFFRYLDPKNDLEFASKEKMEAWMPVDLYVGGAEHAVGHLIYSRFFTKVLKDLGYVTFDEPFKKLVNQGIILGEDGQKMSKSRGNVINPDDVVSEYGADTLRLYEMFLGPLEQMKPWSTQSIIGSYNFLSKVWRYVENWLRVGGLEENKKMDPVMHKLVKRVTDDIEALKFNTAIAAMMEFMNTTRQEKLSPDGVPQLAAGRSTGAFNKLLSKQQLSIFFQLLAPFAPHIAEELWQELGHADSVHAQPWPSYDSAALVESEVTMVVQINGKVRGKITIAADADDATVKAAALAEPNVRKFVTGEPKKVIVVKGRLVSIVV